MSERADDQASISRRDVALWVAALAGPAAALAQVSFGLMLVPAARGQESKALLWLATAVVLVATATGLGYCAARSLHDVGETEARRLVARGGVALGLFSIAVIVVQAMPLWILSLKD
jgi:hypothetical protein